MKPISSALVLALTADEQRILAAFRADDDYGRDCARASLSNLRRADRAAPALRLVCGGAS